MQINMDQMVTSRTVVYVCQKSRPIDCYYYYYYYWEDNIKMDLQEVGGGYGDWMELGQALVSAVMNLRVP
jgi:hypothetical protein